MKKKSNLFIVICAYMTYLVLLAGMFPHSALADSYTSSSMRLLHYEGTVEIEDKTTVVVPKKGHAYGAWTFDAENRQHVRTCANDPSHVERADCRFTSTCENGVETFTCSVCGGTYSETVLSTDKAEYSMSEIGRAPCRERV